MFRHLSIAAVALSLIASSARADTPPAQTPIESFTLANGMEVIVIENHRVPALSHMLWFYVGAADDPPLKSGLAHFHEHMMFKGTSKFKQGEYETLIARHGGKQNAFTGADATAYYVDIAKDQLPLVMELEADRMRGLTPGDADALKEREVIIEERRSRIDNHPSALFGEQLNAALFLNHPYHMPIIGWKHEMEGLTKDDVLKFHDVYYKPNNAVLVVSGDITAAELKPLAEKYYGDIPKSVLPPRIWKEEPPQLAARRLTMRHAEVKQPSWTRSYLAPSLVHGDKAEAIPLSLFAQVLGGGDTSLLYQELVVKQKIATSVEAEYDGFTRGPSEFEITAVPAAGVNIDVLEAAIDKAIGQALTMTPSAADLARAKTLLKAQSIYSREGLQPMAYIIGYLKMLGLPTDYYSHWPALVDAVTAEQALAAAQKTLKIATSVTGVLLPEKMPEPAAPAEKTVKKKEKKHAK